MKKLLVAISIVVSVAGAWAQDTKKESPFEGWSVLRGEWEAGDKGLFAAKSQCDFQLNDLPKNYVEMAFSLQIVKGSENPNTTGQGFTLTWEIEPDESDGVMRAIILRDTQMKFHSFPGKPEYCSSWVPCQFNSKKPVKVLLKITRDSAVLKGGNTSLKKSYDSKPIGLVQFHIPEGAEIKLMNMKVKSK